MRPWVLNDHTTSPYGGSYLVRSYPTQVFATEYTPDPGTPGRLHVWDVATGREVLNLPLDYEPNPYKMVLSGLRFDARKLYIEHPL
jgi:hypothetical protein